MINFDMNIVTSFKSDIKHGKYGFYIVFHADDGNDYTMSAKNFLIGLKKVNAKAQTIFKDTNELNNRQLVCSLYWHKATLDIVDSKVYLRSFSSKWL